MKRKILISVSLIINLISCTKDENIGTTSSEIYFSGITMTDKQGYIISELDTTDWRFDDIWTTKEENLFSNTYNISSQECTSEIFVYPNPFQSIFRINLNNLPNSSRLELRLINKEFEVILKNDSINNSVTLKPEGISNYDTLRLYYRLIDSQNNEYRGHGDILIKD